MKARQIVFALLLATAFPVRCDVLLKPITYLVDIVMIRPLGLVATVAGAGVFAGISPLTALASIPEPHDAFAVTAGILIAAPAGFTFVRPVGDFYPYYGP